MKNIGLASKIKSLRLQKGLSQEKLATDAQLSLRTIQRIENGETEPRGYTLNRLAESLGLAAEELTEVPGSTNRSLITILNLSAFSFILFPLLGIIVPLVIWTLAKEKTKSINEVARQILNFQILWCIAVGLVYTMFFTNVPVPHPSNIGRPEFILLTIGILYIVNFALITINMLLGLTDRKPFYQGVVKFVR